MSLAPLRLDDRQRATLLALARSSLRRHLGDAAAPVPDLSDPELRRQAGAFVTLRTAAGDLRGCIGRTDATAPLADVVERMAIAAGTRDPRFPAVRLGEVDELIFEVSVLGPPVPCRPDEIEIGRDGLVVARGGRRGLLLPQVASERGWDRETFLDATCHKAGLPEDAWRRGADVFRFEATHFEEGESEA